MMSIYSPHLSVSLPVKRKPENAVRFAGNTDSESSKRIAPEVGDHYVPSANKATEKAAANRQQSHPSPWVRLLDEMLETVEPEQETVNGIPVADLIYLREKLRRAPKQSPLDQNGRVQELKPCPFKPEPSKPWALLDQETMGSDHPDAKRFWDIVNGKNSPKDMLDKISKRQVKIGPKGQISFPQPQIKRPKIWWGQPGSQQSKRGQQGKNGQPQPGEGIGNAPGKKAGDVIGKQPADGPGKGKGKEGEGGEGVGDYPKELWTPPISRSEVAKLLGKEWGLPFIEPRGQGKMKKFTEIWDQTTTTPPNQLERNLTLKNAIRRSYAKAWYEKPLIMEDRIQNGMTRESSPIHIKKIHLKGNTLVGTKSLEKAIEKFKGKDLDYNDLTNLLTEIDKKYQASGYATSKAIIPKQGANSDELTVDVREVADDFKPEKIQVHPKDNVRIAPRLEPQPVAKTALIYMMDVSGSVSDTMKEMARVQNYFMDTHLMYQYGQVAAQLSNEKYDEKKHFGQGVVRRFIVHTDGAEETSEEDFYTTGQSGGTRISSAYELAKDMIDKDFPPEDWNIYLFYQGDGDNFGNDNEKTIGLMKDLLDKGVNMMGYTHLAPQWSGWNNGNDGLDSQNFFYALKKKLGDRPNVRTSILHKPELEEYKQSIKRLLEEPAQGGKKK